MMTVLEQLQGFLREYTGDNSMVVRNDTTILSDMGLSSYDLAQLVGVVEAHFRIEISDRAAMQMRTAGDLVAYIEKNR